MRHVSKGFSLIELVIVVAIIGVLSAIAIPMYQGYLQQSKAQEATTNLMSMKTEAEQYYASHPDTGYANYPCTPPADAPMFDYTCPAADKTAETLTIQARGKDGTNVVGWTYTINQNGVRTSSGIGSSSSTTCWITKLNGAC